MTKRQDGKETRLRLLNAACEVFAQKGYRDAKVADICNRANANMAAVNYYFKDKTNLYTETWGHTFQQYEEPELSDLESGSPQERLRKYIHALMKHFNSKGISGHFSRLYMMELVNPTGLIQDVWHELISPRIKMLHDIIREIIGRKADNQRVLFCALSIINQCRVLSTVKPVDLEYFLEHPLDPELIERLADHIIDFSLAGINAVGNTLE